MVRRRRRIVCHRLIILLLMLIVLRLWRICIGWRMRKHHWSTVAMGVARVGRVYCWRTWGIRHYTDCAQLYKTLSEISALSIHVFVTVLNDEQFVDHVCMNICSQETAFCFFCCWNYG
jgi:hypothetical protein